MGKLRVTYIVEYEVTPEAYGVQTMEQAAAEDQFAFDNDVGALIDLDGESTIKVEVIDG